MELAQVLLATKHQLGDINIKHQQGFCFFFIMLVTPPHIQLGPSQHIF